MHQSDRDALPPALRDELARCVRARWDLLREEATAAARRHGYALAVHGSMERDIDLVAVPWADDAQPAEVVVAEIMDAIARVNGGVAFVTPGVPVAKKPHGRRAWAIRMGGTYVDLSVMPRKNK